MEKLTPRQEDLMRFIGQYWQQNKLMPTLREMMEGLGYSSTGTVQGLVNHLINKGYLEKVPGVSARNIRIAHMINSIPVVGTCN